MLLTEIVLEYMKPEIQAVTNYLGMLMKLRVP